MKLLLSLLGFKTKEARKTIAEHQRETLVSAGRQQFKKLRELGLNIPVRLA